MPSVSGQEGVKLDDFLKMWTEDGTKLIEQDHLQVDGAIWLLYSVYFPESTCDYGRHLALLLKIETESQIILLHDIENLTNNIIGGGHRSVKEWFEEHALNPEYQ